MGFFYQSPPSENRVPFRGNMIGASPCFVAGMTKAQKDHYISVMSETLAQLAKQYSAKIVLLPSLTTRGKAMVVSGREDDFAVSNLILNVMADQFRDIEVQICYTDSVDEFVNTLSHLDMLVSTRMHPTIFAAGVGVPFVEVIYEHKQVGLLKNLNLPEVGISVSDITVDSLFKRSVFVWENRDSIRRHLTSTITSLKSKNGRILGSLITSLATN
jgi:polysaccharide pyruvyl transferase WcaK-like protein